MCNQKFAKNFYRCNNATSQISLCYFIQSKHTITFLKKRIRLKKSILGVPYKVTFINGLQWGEIPKSIITNKLHSRPIGR